jgi:hypothetical protein
LQRLKSNMDARKIILFLAVLFSLFLINFMVSSNFIGGQDFYVNWAFGRLVFNKGINPYSQDANILVTELAKSILVLPVNGEYRFLSPLFSLFFYFPFTFIPNFIFARTLWMTLSEILIYSVSGLTFNILDWHPGKKERIVFMFFSFVFFYSILTLLRGGDTILLFFCFLLSINLINNHDDLGAGILLSLLAMKPLTFFIPVVVLFYYLSRKKGWNAIFWFFVSVILLIMSAYLWVPDWPVLYLREILRNFFESGMALPGILMNQWVSDTNQIIWNFLAALLIGILFIEVFIKDYENRNFLWKISLALVFNPLICIQNNTGILVILLLPFGLIFKQWSDRDNKIGFQIMIFLVFLFSLALILLSFITRSILYLEPFPLIFYILPMIFLILNLYWVRGWLFSKNALKY